ncbi:methylenetetrahydrofolate reductase [Favolaschia claudopus]|uniref:Methylenetetrahydrofolate reductase n=1 Tax=Favolaschia claudopus TaxID=2862362 RepID=A0AAV9ZT69_9AGAR
MTFSSAPSRSVLPSGASAASLRLSLHLNQDPLLSESLTLSSLSSSNSSTPPLPAGCMVPLATIIGHQDGPTMSRRSSVRNVNRGRATLTSPTPPRLRTMLKEKLLVETWLNGVAVDSEDHNPWGGIDSAEPTAWKSEGSLYSPHVFKTKMASARRRTTPEPMEPTVPPRRLNASRKSLNRNALVFEREIILNSGGRPTRMSLQASSSSMEPGVADMISELRNLNSFFKGQDAPKILERPANLPPPPSLIVSNSHFSLPVSLESSGNLVSNANAPLALAARRGKKMLPPLSLKPPSTANEYPSMPTAFLGSPSTYSPQFEFASHPNRPSMDLHQMVSSLRSQCVPLDPGQQVEADGEDDEWAFADGFLDAYQPQPFDSEFVKKPLRPDMVDYAAESLKDSLLPVKSHTRSPSPLTPPPSTPLPPCPVQPRSVRSILKSSKSVRFASLPNERAELPEDAPVVDPRPRRSLPSTPPSKRPLPPRPQSHTVRPTIPAPLYRSPALKPTSTFTRTSKQAKAAVSHNAEPSNPRPTTKPAAKSSPRKPVPSNRHSLSRVFSSANLNGSKEKENKPSVLSEPPRAAQTPNKARWTLNENVLRRGSTMAAGIASASEAQTQTQKTRMPVPLRNILTRFK